CEIIISFGLQELLVKLSRHWLEARNQRFGVISPDPQEKMEEIRSIVHDQLSTQWSVPEMAKLGNLSASRFAFLYKKIFDVTPMEDLIRKRIRQASILLSDTSKSIAEIAEESGFEDLQYFYRSFKKRLGTTPKRLRTRNSSASPWKSYDEQRGNLEAVWASSDFHGMIGSNEEGTPFIQAVSGDWSQLGWNRHELTCQPLLDLIHPDDDCLVKKASESVLAGGLLHNLKLRTLCKNGHFLKIEWTGASSGDAFYFSANIAKQI
ncbi:MAG: helix-turn-helix domain-containing protein, partial [Opitutales bacterium]